MSISLDKVEYSSETATYTYDPGSELLAIDDGLHEVHIDIDDLEAVVNDIRKVVAA